MFSGAGLRRDGINEGVSRFAIAAADLRCSPDGAGSAPGGAVVLSLRERWNVVRLICQACCELLESRVHFAADPPTILFVRGAPRSGGFLEGVGVEPRNGQLAD